MRSHRSFLIVMLFFILIHTVLLLWAPLFPFTDLPNHLAEATIYKYGHPQNLIGQYYESVPGFYPNTFHTVFCSLFPSVEWGNRIFYALYAVLLLTSVYLVIRQLNGNSWYGLLCLLFIYNYNTTWGFTGFTIAIPTTIFLFYTALFDIKRPRIGYTIAASLLLVLLYLMHAQMALFGLLLYGCMMLYAFWKRWKIFFLRIFIAVLPVICIVGIWWTHRATEQAEGSTISFLAHYYKTVYFKDFYKRILLFVYDQMALFSGLKGIAAAIVILLLIILPLFFYKAWTTTLRSSLKSGQFIYPFIFVVLSTGCFFVLPNELPGQSPLYQRFCTVVFLSFIIFASVLMKEVRSRAFSFYTIAACLLYSFFWGQYFYAFNKENEAFRPSFFKQVPPQKILSGLMFENKFRGREVYLHFPGYNLVWNHGLTTSKAIDYRFGVVRRGNRGNEIPFYQEWIGKNSRIISSYQDSVHYLLVKEKQPVQPDSNLVNFKPVLQTAQWSLYKNSRIN
jgi:hypothetical protein